MRRRLESTDEEIYADYLLSVTQDEPVYLVAQRHDCRREHISRVVKRVEAKQRYPVGENARKAIWDFKYSKIQDLIRQRQTKDGLQRALVRDMFFRAGFDVTEIAKYCRISKTVVRVMIWG